MSMFKSLLVATAAIGLSVTAPGLALARDNGGVTALQAAPAALDREAAYILLRTSTAKTGLFPIQHVFLRIPSAAEMAAYRAAKQAAFAAALPKLSARQGSGPPPNIDDFAFDYDGPANTFVAENGKFLEDGEMRTLLLRVPAGSYILYGSTSGGRGLVTCNCLGTVRFAAAPGTITDIGSLYADKVHKPSPVPHLEDNLGPQMFQYGFIFGQALVPADDRTPVPASLRALPRVRATFAAVGEYYEPGAGSINRLAPIPGVLGYDKGRAIDVATGRRAE